MMIRDSRDARGSRPVPTKTRNHPVKSDLGPETDDSVRDVICAKWARWSCFPREGEISDCQRNRGWPREDDRLNLLKSPP